MKTSETITTIAPALLKAQKLINWATKNAKNPYFKSRYADLSSVIEACKPALNDNGIVMLQPTGIGEHGSFVETILLHESGEWVKSKTPIVCAKPDDPQALGSAITYAKRYGIQALNLLPSEDDDGEAAMARGKESQENEHDDSLPWILNVPCPVCGFKELNKWNENWGKGTYAYCKKKDGGCGTKFKTEAETKPGVYRRIQLIEAITKIETKAKLAKKHREFLDIVERIVPGTKDWAVAKLETDVLQKIYDWAAPESLKTDLKESIKKEESK